MIRRRVLERILLYGIWAGFVLILLTPLVVTHQTVYPHVVGKALYSRSLIEIVFALWILLALCGSSHRPPRSRLLFLFAVSLGVSVLAAYSGVSPERSLWSTYDRMQGVVDMAHWVVLAVVLAATVRTTRNWCTLLNLNLGVSLVIALLAISQYYSVNMPAFSDQSVAVSDLRPGIDRHGRAFATFGNAGYLGVYMTMNVVIALGFVMRSFIPAAVSDPSPPPREVRGRRHEKRRLSPPKRTSPHTGMSGLVVLWSGRLFWGGTALLDLWAIRLSGSRGALLGIVASIGFVVVLYLLLRRSRVVRLASLGLAGLLAGAAMVSAISLFRSDTLPFDTSLLDALANRQGPEAIETAHRSTRKRIALLKTALQGFADRPVLGWGPENFIVVYGRHFPHDTGLDYGGISDYAHSKLAEESATKGLIGLLIYLSLWVLTFRVVVRAARSTEPRERALILFAGAALMGMFVQSQFLFDTASGSLQHVLLLALVANLEVVRRGPVPVQGRGTYFRRNGVGAVTAMGAMILVGAGLFANHAAYSAASGIMRIAKPTNTPEQDRDYLREAITGFKPLARFPRLLLFRTTMFHWAALRTRSEAEVQRMLALIDAEAAAAIESEPENWTLHDELARFYGFMASVRPEYRAVAEHHLERLSELAPNRAPSR